MVKLQQVTPVTSWKCFDLSSILKQLESFVLLTTPLRAEPQYYLKTKLTSHMTLSRSLFLSQESLNFIKSGHSVVKRTDFGNVISFLFAAHTARSPVDFLGDMNATLSKAYKNACTWPGYPARPLPRGHWAKYWCCFRPAFWLIQSLTSCTCPQQLHVKGTFWKLLTIWKIFSISKNRE